MNFDKQSAVCSERNESTNLKGFMKNAENVILLLKKCTKGRDFFLISLADSTKGVEWKHDRIVHALKLDYETDFRAQDIAAIVSATILAFPEESAGFVSEVGDMFPITASMSRHLAIGHGSLAGTVKALVATHSDIRAEQLAQAIELWITVLTHCEGLAEMPKDVFGEFTNDLHKLLKYFSLYQCEKLFKPFSAFLQKSYEEGYEVRPLLDQVSSAIAHALFSRLEKHRQLALIFKEIGGL
ncbi:MAG TPA: hypothetical protein VJJ55_00750 [Candidatus Paceibacterota bacterium]